MDLHLTKIIITENHTHLSKVMETSIYFMIINLGVCPLMFIFP